MVQPAFDTLTDMLANRASTWPDQTMFRHLQYSNSDTKSCTYASLNARAKKVAAGLSKMTERGDRIVLIYPQGLEFLEAIFGCWYAGLVVAPLGIPKSRTAASNLSDTIDSIRPKVLLTTDSKREQFCTRFKDSAIGSLKWWTINELPKVSEIDSRRVESDDLALLQYTSGSTSRPKGVMLTHKNLLSNAAQVHEAFGLPRHPKDSMVSWLPFFHDMGLMAGVIGPIYSGIVSNLISPVEFAQQPIRWLSAISDYKATLSGGPNFAFELCSYHAKKRDLSNIDLSNWRFAFCGAEPIRWNTLERFVRAFKQCGFRSAALQPCYGLAEATVAVTVGRDNIEPQVVSISEEALSQGKFQETTNGKLLVGCGKPVKGTQINIKHPETLASTRSDEIGEVWIKGPSIGKGYWGARKDTEASFVTSSSDSQDNNEFRTGDLGIMHNGELFITGRLSDLIIIRGRNVYPQDIENSVEQSHECLIPGSNAAFSVDDNDTEHLILVQEARRSCRADMENVFECIRSAIARHHAITPLAIVLAWPAQVPRGSSGKIQRNKCKKRYLENKLKHFGTWNAKHDHR